MNTLENKKKLFSSGLKPGSNTFESFMNTLLEISLESKCFYKAIISIYYFFIIINVILSILEIRYNKNIIKI